MPYYPSFAFFEKPVQIESIARVMVEKLGSELPEIGFEISNADGGKTIVTENHESVLQFLEKEGQISRFWLASEFHSIDCMLMQNGYLAVDFWDFDSEVYNSGGPSEEMRASKRRLALMLHTTLIRNCDALLSYTSSADDKYSGPDGHYETGDMVIDLIRSRKSDVFLQILQRPLFFWLVGLRKPTAIANLLEAQLQKDFGDVYQENDIAIFEHKTNRPFFLE